MSLASGTRLGPYEIVAPLGAGGMGEVYRARDTRLDRTVAIKILPTDFAEDARLKIRFAREAKMISALSHPHICTLHDVGREKDLDYLVMEYCEGKTLAKRIAEKALPVDEVLEYGIQIADALDKAHRQGIIHRDLKPSNIILTRSGVKLLDFGLARHDLASAPAESTVQQVTEEGTILGTVQYMAPELLQGREADARSDLFALGLVLYEMTTGKPPFTGTSRASLIAAILEHEPKPATEVEPASPAALDRLIRACLEKDPDQRIQSAHDLKLQLKWIAEPELSAARMRHPSWRRAGWAALGIAVAAVVASLIGFGAGRRSNTAYTPLRSFSVNVGDETEVSHSVWDSFDVSSDGERLAWFGMEKEPGLHVRKLETGETTYLPATGDGFNPFFSPDGEWVGFIVRTGELKKVSVRGGVPVVFGRAPSAGASVRGATWGRDGTVVFSHDGTLWRISAEGGIPDPLLRRKESGETLNLWPHLLPDGEHVLYTIYDATWKPERHSLAVASLKTGESRMLLRGGSHGRFLDPGYILYAHGATLFAVRVDTRSLRLIGEPIALIDGVNGHYPTSLSEFAVSSEGSLFYLPRAPRQETEFVRVDSKGGIAPITRMVGAAGLDISPDGNRILTTVEAPAGGFDVWFYDIPAETWTRVTMDQGSNGPRWSPDGSAVVFSSSRSGWRNLFMVPADATADARPLTPIREGWAFATTWANERTLLFHEWRHQTGWDLRMASMDGNVEPLRVSETNELAAAISPDGSWVAYESNESGRPEIYVEPYRRPGGRLRVSADGGGEPAWSRDGRRLHFWSSGTIMAVDVMTTPAFRARKPRPLFPASVKLDAMPVQLSDGSYVGVRHEQPWRRSEFRVMIGLAGELQRRLAQR